MQVILSGTGTSQGVPVIACDCDTCTSEDSRDKRTRTSAILERGNTRIVIDTGPDFRQQMLRHNVQSLQAVLFTHAHKDHIAGLDDIRAFNFKQNQALNVYATREVQHALKREYAYIFDNQDYPGVPQINLIEIRANVPFEVGDFHFLPIEVMHGKLPVLAFRTLDFTYITDANFISTAALEQIKGSTHVVINGLRNEAHHSHFTLQEAVEVLETLAVKKGYITHISHLLGRHADVEPTLPQQVQLAYDGLSFELE